MNEDFGQTDLLNFSDRLIAYYNILQNIGLEKGYNIPLLLYQYNCDSIEEMAQKISVDTEINNVIEEYNLIEKEYINCENSFVINKNKYRNLVKAIAVLFIINGIYQYHPDKCRSPIKQESFPSNSSLQYYNNNEDLRNFAIDLFIIFDDYIKMIRSEYPLKHNHITNLFENDSSNIISPIYQENSSITILNP